MGALEIIFAALIMIVSLGLILLVMAQKSREEGLGSSFGDAGAFEGQRGASYDMVLRRWTKILAVLFGVLIVIANIVVFVIKK